MAQHMSLKEVKALAVKPYQAIRTILHSGDLLFTSGDYLVSKAIQQCTDSPWSHVGIIFRIDTIDRMLLLESVEDMGVRFAPLSKYLSDYENKKPYKGRVVIARCEDIHKEITKGLAQYGVDELTRPYDKDEIAKIVARIALGISRKECDRKYICSELVYECFSEAGREFEYDPRVFISPENIWLDPHVEMIARIL
jgi:hypothetical protein